MASIDRYASLDLFYLSEWIMIFFSYFFILMYKLNYRKK